MKVVVLYLFLFAFSVGGIVGKDVIVGTYYGAVRGQITSKSQQFLGIPYAQPPVGNMRWRSPARPKSWYPDVYNATVARPACPQKYCSKFMPVGCPKTDTSEDCLFLNVWTPLNATVGTSYPVMFWIHGGAFKFGFANGHTYDGNNMANDGDVIVVSIDYRLGVLGFMYTGEGEDDAQGNFAIQDQRAALQWVRENIRWFGGDQTKVTIFGQSAGAQSVFAHLMSPQSVGMFRAAVVESSPFGVPYRTKPDALKLSESIARILHCEKDDMTCMRSRTVDEVNDAQEDSIFRLTALNFLDYFEPFSPIIDDSDIPMQPMEAAAKGVFQKMPMIVGTVTEEGRMFVYGLVNFTMPKLMYDAGLLALHPEHNEEVQRMYPVPKTVEDYRDAYCDILTDYLFTCATRNASRNVILNGVRDVYRYVFAHASVNRGGWGRATYCEGHVCHAEELGFLFENPVVPGNVTADESKLSKSLMSYWTNFAHTLDPNVGPNAVKLNWTKYQSTEESIMYFQTPENKLKDNYRGNLCDFWDNVGYSELKVPLE